MHRKLLNLLILFLVTFSVIPSWAQTVQGRVTDVEGSPLEYVNVAIVNVEVPVGTITDRHGYYRLAVPGDRPVQLRFSFSGMKTIDTLVSVKDGSQTLDIQMRLSSTQLDVIVISGGEGYTDQSLSKIDIAPLVNVAGPSNGVETLLKTLPDVNSNNELSSQYSVRGGSFDENLVYINDVEVYRPMLVRCGQQEGMSIVNSEMVSNILFSPGGFDVTYGDKLSSVLDLDYSRPTGFKAGLSASFLGASATLQGLLGEKQRLSYSLGFRRHSNNYIFSSLDTRGEYVTAYTDFQSILGYQVNEKLDLSLLTIFSRNRYGLVPQSRVTTFGSFMEELQLEVFFDGRESDRYFTRLGAFTLDYHPDEDFRMKWITSVQSMSENEIYDIQSQYWLYELGMGETVGEFERFDRGYGTFLEHARNYLATDILTTEVKAVRNARMGEWKFGLKYQYEHVDDQVLEWKWVDSANYSLPFVPTIPGDSANEPQNPILQNYCHAYNILATHRLSAYAQRNFTFLTRHDDKISLTAGVRSQLYRPHLLSSTSPSDSLPLHFFVSPRVSCTYRPHQHDNLLFRTAVGLYHQPPFYREYRVDDGTLNLTLKSPNSFQAVTSADWGFKVWDKPIRLTADLFYKYVTNHIPYRIDNLRVRYDATNDAVAYAAGFSLRLSGELVEGLESWGSFSVLKTQEDLLGDDLGWIDRPTDQRISFKLFLQDEIPTIPFWRMSLNFVLGSGLPTLRPNSASRDNIVRLPAYYRVDWGNTIQLSQFERLRDKPLFQKIDDLQISLEVFNLFDYHNVVSFLWVADYNNMYYPVPEYLTARQFNLKVTMLF